jgi:hypothetical protein
VCDDLRTYVAVYLGETDGVLIIDETGLLKRASNQPVCTHGSTLAPRSGRAHHRARSRQTQAPQLLTLPGVSAVAAATVLLGSSHLAASASKPRSPL